MVYSDFNAYILMKFLQILTNYYTSSKIVNIIKKNQNSYTIKITSLKKQKFNIITITQNCIIKKEIKKLTP